jgi:hypothetical protein
MSFIVSLAHFIGWLILVPALIYLVVSDVITLYAFIFWYMNSNPSLEMKAQFALRVGFKNFWIWFFGFLLQVYSACMIRKLHRDGFSGSQISEEFWRLDPEEIEQLKTKVTWHPLSSIKNW